MMSIQNFNRTRSNGMISLDTPETVLNPIPEILFDGEIANYSVTPGINRTLLGFNTFVICTPTDNGWPWKVVMWSAHLDCRPT